MAEQSATTVTLRALIMLSCAVALTWVALFGTSLPDRVRSFLADGEQTDPPDQTPPFTAPSEPATAAPGQFASPPFGPSNPQVQSNVAPYAATTPNAPAQWGQSADNPRWDTSGSGTNAVAVGYTIQQPYVEPSSAPTSSQSPPRSIHEQMAGRSSIAHATDLGARGMAPMAQAVDPFTNVQQQLRQLGVTYSSLETWGDQGLYYRFHCRAAIQGDPTMARPFQATDTDAVRAMNTVLQQVQQWRAGSL